MSGSANNPGFMCGREATKVARTDLNFVQLSWAGGKGCGGDQNNDDEATTGVMCVQIDSDGARSRKCSTAEDKQLFRMEKIDSALFSGTQNQKNAVGSYPLRDKIT
eukprot:COSAG05_NODE_565_length_8643_cov_5.314373_5_plen_106_part_00